jgi:hypothetical protein
MFEQAKKNAPCIVFIDEIDAVGRHRGAGIGGGNDEREQTLNQLLVEMDGFEANEGVIIIAATNRPTCSTRRCCVPAASTARSWCRTPTSRAARRSWGPRARCRWPRRRPAHHRPRHARLLGRRPANLVNEAALMAARIGNALRHHGEFEDAKDKVMMGAERRSMVMTEEGKKLTAYHEAGHAIVGMKLPKRSGLQGDDHPARPCAGHGDALPEDRWWSAQRHADGGRTCLCADHHRSRSGCQPRASAGRLTRRFAGLPLDRPLVMAIVNVTPDSFSDGGERLDEAQAIVDGLRRVEAFTAVGKGSRASRSRSPSREGDRAGGPRSVASNARLRLGAGTRSGTGGGRHRGTSDRRRRASVPTTTGPAPGASPEPQPGV